MGTYIICALYRVQSSGMTFKEGEEAIPEQFKV